MLPQANHDELARQNFVASLKAYIVGKLSPQNQAIYEQIAKPEFEQEHGRSPQNRYEVAQVMQDRSYYRWWSALRRTQQELMWESVNISVDRQLPQLIQQAKSQQQPIGSLSIDPNFRIPKYQTAVDIHCMPGGYHSEFVTDDIAAGATYDRGVYIYGLGCFGPLNDDLGASVIDNYLLAKYPTFQPHKIIDLGCSIGHSTLPYVDAYPNAEVYAIDIGASMLRYAHARAESLHKKVHFQQQNAERTNFPGNHFDLVVSHILLHEMPVFAIRNVLRESYRLLAPGGMMIHVEAPLYCHMDAYRAFLFDWETANNNEPFWSGMRDLDLKTEIIQAGFSPEQVREEFVPNGAWKARYTSDSQTADLSNRGSWLIFTGTK
jgi:SAM-dependent methyltransferase